MTLEELQQTCRDWQIRLRLQDWDVSIKFDRKFNLPDKAQGLCVRTINKKTASIFILDPIDYDPDILRLQDIEQTVVHELIHLHFAGFDGIFTEHHTMAEEQAINALAAAFVQRGIA